MTFPVIADFWYATFGKSLSFRSAKFLGETNFRGITLPHYLDFSQVTKIAHEIDLHKALSNPNYTTCNINLTDAAIEKFKFRYKRFTLWFPEEDSIGYELIANVYEELLKIQKDRGYTQSFEKLDKEYKAFQYTHYESGKGLWGHILNWVEKNWWDYGYGKELVVRNVILIFLIISLLNAFILKHLTRKVYMAPKISAWFDEVKGSRITVFFKTIPFSLFYTAQIFFGFKFDVENLNYRENLEGLKIFNLVYFISIFLSGIVCLAYLANYVITV